MIQHESFYTVQQVASLWQVSEDTVRNLFRNDPSTLKLGSPKRGKRAYRSIRIPDSALVRMGERLRRGMR